MKFAALVLALSLSACGGSSVETTEDKQMIMPAPIMTVIDIDSPNTEARHGYDKSH